MSTGRRVDRLSRLLRIVQLLHSGRAVEPDSLANSLNISRRTLYRDLRILDDAGIGFRFSRNRSAFQPKQPTLLPPVHLTSAEALSLLMLIRHGLGARLLPKWREATSASLKIEGLLPKHLVDHCGPLLAAVEFRPAAQSDVAAVEDRILFLQRAIAARIRIDIVYESLSPRETVSTVVHPYRVVHAQRGWYLIAYSEQHGGTRLFKIERFQRMTPTSATFRMDPEFSVEKHFGRAWSVIRGEQTHRVRVRFSSLVARNVAEVQWHATQRVLNCADGSVLFTAEVDGLREVLWWILGYGDEAEVLEPRELRDMVRQRAKRMVALYQRRGDALHEVQSG